MPKLSDLVAYCEARGVAYADDPSNADPRFARPRLRQLREFLAAEGLDAAALARLGRRAALAEEALAKMAAQAEARLGLARHRRCDAAALVAEPLEIVRRLLALAIAEPVALEALERIAAELAAAAGAGRRYAANVGGVLIVHERGIVTLAPEPPRRG